MKKCNNKHPVLKAILLILLIIFIVLAAAAGFIWSKLDLIQYADETEPAISETVSVEEEEELVDISGLTILDEAPEVPDTEVVSDDHVLNILILGTDERTTEFSSNARSDCMIIVSIDQTKNTVKLVSLERGMGVPVLEGQYEGQYDWLTHMFRYGGADLVMKTVEHCFKIEIDHYVRFNFKSVTQIVDALGGVTIDLTSSEVGYLGLFYDMNSSTGKQAPLRVGSNLLDGGNALAYARLREIDSDWRRVERQRKVILAVVNKLKGSSLTELNSFVDGVLPMIQTNLTKLEIAELMIYAPNLLSASFDQMTIPKSGTYGGMKGMGGRSLFAVDFDTNSEILHDFLYGTE